MNTCLYSVLSQLQPDEKLVLVTAEGCHACKAVKKEIEGSPVIISPIETPEGNELSNKAGIFLFPSLLVVRGTEPVARVSLGTCLLTQIRGLDSSPQK